MNGYDSLIGLRGRGRNAGGLKHPPLLFIIDTFGFR
jgi:hypothetical protein